MGLGMDLSVKMGSVAFCDPRIQLIVAVVEVELSSRSILQKRTEKW